MNTPQLLSLADTYLNAQLRDSRSPWRARETGPFITISREAGSGGSSFACVLARKLNAEAEPGVTWRVFEDNLMAQMLRQNQLPTQFARYLPEERISELNASIGELVGLHPNLWELVQKSNETMRQLASEGHVILVGRGSNLATARVENGLHVRLVAPPAHRARYLAERYNLSEAQAYASNARCDAARRGYVKATFNADVADPTAYDLIINTATMSFAEAAELVGVRLRHKIADRV